MTQKPALTRKVVLQLHCSVPEEAGPSDFKHSKGKLIDVSEDQTGVCVCVCWSVHRHDAVIVFPNLTIAFMSPVSLWHT